MSESIYLLGETEGSLILIPEAEARRLARLHKAAQESTTWGTFLDATAFDDETREYLSEEFGEEMPDASEPFDAAEDLPGYADGDWPDWPQREMLRWLPDSIRALGTVDDSVLSGEFLDIPADHREDVIAAMEAAGLRVAEDTENLVDRASGR